MNFSHRNLPLCQVCLNRFRFSQKFLINAKSSFHNPIISFLGNFDKISNFKKLGCISEIFFSEERYHRISRRNFLKRCDQTLTIIFRKKMCNKTFIWIVRGTKASMEKNMVLWVISNNFGSFFNCWKGANFESLLDGNSHSPCSPTNCVIVHCIHNTTMTSLTSLYL